MEKSGLYIHIPFCKNKCPYCDFYSVKYCKEDAENYVDNLINIMKQYQGTFDTVYFGGGTPSILDYNLIGEILEEARKNLDIDDKSEITVECNPSKDLQEDFKAYSSFGINRISIGMQSAVDKERFALGRSASSVQVEKTINYARTAGINNISLDLMIGTPKQTINSLDESFDFVKSTGVTHLSAYMLKLEKGTKFFDMKDRLELPYEDEVSDMYLKTVDYMNSIGLLQYEISNFAKPGFESKHNTKYWTLTPYLGLGKSAHSFWDNRRFYYDKEWNKIDDGTGGSEEERIVLGLRLNSGIPKSIVKKDYLSYVKLGFMEEKGENISLTPKGMLVSNTIISCLI